MRVCLKNMKYLYYNYQEADFGYYVGNCYVENGIITGFGNSDAGFDNVVDMTGKLVLPMFADMNINLEEIIFRQLKGNWDSVKVGSLENCFGTLLGNKNKEYYETLAPGSIRELVENGVGLVTTRRCWKAVSKAPILGLAGYPVTRDSLLKHYLDIDLFNSIMSSNNSPNIIHGVFLRGLANNDEGTLTFAKNALAGKAKFVTATIGQNQLTKNVVKQKWLKDDLSVLSSYGLLGPNTLLFGCNELTPEEIFKIKDANATMIYTPIASKTISNQPGNVLDAENAHADWCLASGSLAQGVTANMLYHMQNLKTELPQLTAQAILKSVCITPLVALRKISGIDISGQANFTVIDAPQDFIDARDCITWLFSVDTSTLKLSLMMGGGYVSYTEQDSIEECKSYLRSFYKRFDMFLENPNMFLNEVPQKMI